MALQNAPSSPRDAKQSVQRRAADSSSTRPWIGLLQRDEMRLGEKGEQSRSVLALPRMADFDYAKCLLLRCSR